MKNFVCSECGAKNDDYGQNCKKCRNRKSRKEYYEKNKDKCIQQSLKRINNLKQNNKCTLCGKDRDNKTTLCNKCRKNQNPKSSKYMEERRNRLLKEGLCISCGNRKQTVDTNYCESCLITRRERARIFQENKKELN